MMTQMLTIIQMIVNSFLHVWPYLLLTIPLAVAVEVSGVSKYITKALQAKPLIAILLATAVGAFSPFCSCGVIPIITTLLIGGVPIAPVMSFWIASPSMDPEIFFLSVAAVGWELAVWRLAATLVLSLSAGFITHILVQRGWLGEQILRLQKTSPARSRWEMVANWLSLSKAWNLLKTSLMSFFSAKKAIAATCCASAINVPQSQPSACGCSAEQPQACGCDAEQPKTCGCSTQSMSQWRRLAHETWKATAMVVKFMALAFFVKAVITLYIPAEWTVAMLGNQNPFSILTATLIGVPMYTSNLTALPMISGLLAQGMDPGAALAFLISGSVTTLPAMAAVYGIVNRRVFALYLAFPVLGSPILGYVYHLFAR